MYNLIRALGLVCLLSVAGCGLNKQVVKKEPNYFEKNLAHNLADLATYARSHASSTSLSTDIHNSNIIQYELLPRDLNRLLDVKYYGDAQKLIESLANYCGFSFSVLGDVKSNKNLVYVNVKDTPLVEILNLIGSQISEETTVKVDVRVKQQSFTVKLVGNNL